MFLQFQNRLIDSSMFEFIVGPKRKVFKVHTAAISRQSQALNTLMNGRMMEALAQSATLPDLDADTFVRFCQFAYSGNYDEPAFEVVEKRRNAFDLPSRSSLPASSSTPPAAQGWTWDFIPETVDWIDAHGVVVNDVWDDLRGGLNALRYEHVRGLRTEQMKRLFAELSYPLTYHQSITLPDFTPRHNRSPDESYTSVFLGHARLYVFGEKYGIEPLKLLALHKLHRTLTVFEISARIEDVVELIRYAYSEENTPDREDRADGLRRLVLSYVAVYVHTLGSDERFVDLLTEGGAFVEDFWSKVKGRVL